MVKLVKEIEKKLNQKLEFFKDSSWKFKKNSDIEVLKTKEPWLPKIIEILPKEKAILELGSGKTTQELVKHYNVFSVEHDPKWLNKYKSNYIYAPLNTRWYDVNILKKELPQNYDLILIDGPPAYEYSKRYSRIGFLRNLDLFDTTVPMVFDDTNRKSEYKLAKRISEIVKREVTYFKTPYKGFAIV